MNIYFYARVSAFDQNLDRQLIAASVCGVSSSKVFTEKLSGKDTKRPELQRLMSTVVPGDTVIVESISRFARNTRDLLDLVERLNIKGVEFISLKENIDTTTPTGKFMLTVFGAVAELERVYILQRQREGVVAAKARGVRFGRPTKNPPENFSELVWQIERGKLSTKDAQALSGLKEATFYRRLSEQRSAMRR